MKLKTLKDIEFSSDNFMIVEQLKQEAIKWIKEFQRQHQTEYSDFFDYNFINESKTYCEVFNWIKHFFNITEEELK